MGSWCDVGEYLEVFVKKNVCEIKYLWYLLCYRFCSWYLVVLLILYFVWFVKKILIYIKY